MCNERFDVDLDRLADHRKGLLAGLALARAAGESRDGHAVSTPGLGCQHLGRQHDLVLAGGGQRFSLPAFARFNGVAERALTGLRLNRIKSLIRVEAICLQ